MRNALEKEALNPAKCDDLDYIHVLIASMDVFSCIEAARCQVIAANSPSHDAFTRLLQRQPPDTEALWDEVKILVSSIITYFRFDVIYINLC